MILKSKLSENLPRCTSCETLWNKVKILFRVNFRFPFFYAILHFGIGKSEYNKIKNGVGSVL